MKVTFTTALLLVAAPAVADDGHPTSDDAVTWTAGPCTEPVLMVEVDAETVVRPETYGPAGHATHHHHGARGALWVEHDAPTGGISGTLATVTVTGRPGAWLADLLGGDSVTAGGLYLEKHVGHGHTAYLLE